jgi:hypothetical protein
MSINPERSRIVPQKFFNGSGFYGVSMLHATWAPDYVHGERFIKGRPLPGAEAFLMLDPNPKTRITSRQLTLLTHGPEGRLGPSYLEACEAC